uniref:Uncharacterized protein n=1 Tax=Candidatus Kentrum sp. FM TaxID=2126340 RepID=A0A450W1N7_9GAMM|nr:MAG: hypothetical protein BECKFM1743C_GA0114222_100082 [Candidatus Kentron sp. FM]VFJ55059.1 MAG: hypothetical protein BECKFM1743A_GA0114220_101414 [Candidatus Kentron sp. FM]VFK10939.1 MAG: hypothetical protein BECKFM1743B_GA0114221_101614 [Candidatus Kentron sp. FM]
MSNPFHFIAGRKSAFLVAMLLLVTGCVTTQEKPQSSLIQTPLPHDVGALMTPSPCAGLILSGRTVSFPEDCLGMTVEAYITDGRKEKYRLTPRGLQKVEPPLAILNLPAGAAVLNTPCDGMRIRPLSHATQVEFPPACQGEALKVSIDGREYRTVLRQGQAELTPLAKPAKRRSRAPTPPTRTPPRQKPLARKAAPPKPAAPRPPAVPTIEIGGWAYEKTPRGEATHQQAEAACRGLGMQLPLHGAFSQAIELRDVSLSQPGEWGDAVNKHEAFMVYATPRGGDYKVIYKNYPLPYRCARKIK